MPKDAIQSDFFASMADPQGFRALFEHLPGVFFFVKDAEGRMIAASAGEGRSPYHRRAPYFEIN